MIHALQRRMEFKHPNSFHPKHLCTWPHQPLTNPSPFLPVSCTMADHTSFRPMHGIEQEEKLKESILFQLNLASELLGCFSLRTSHFRTEFNTWIFFSVPQKHGWDFQNHSVLASSWSQRYNSLQFQQEQQGKARVMKSHVKSFLGFSQKILGNKTEISSFICSHFNSLFSVQQRWRLGGRQDLHREQ